MVLRLQFSFYLSVLPIPEIRHLFDQLPVWLMIAEVNFCSVLVAARQETHTANVKRRLSDENSFAVDQV